MFKFLLTTSFVCLALLQVSQGQDSAPKIEAKLDTIIQKLDASQTTLNSVAAKMGGEPTVTAPATAVPDAGTAAVKADIETVQMNLNYIWMILTGALVFVMQAGFAMVELGFGVRFMELGLAGAQGYHRP